MSAAALALVLAGATCHAIWNIATKKAGGGLAFVWLFGLVSVLAAAPLAVWVWQTQAQFFTPAMWAVAVASGLIHVVYSLVLQQAYKVSDFAVVYPIARGTGPTLSVLAALFLLGEKPAVLGWAGVASVLAGVFLSAGALDLLRRQPAAAHDLVQKRQIRQKGVIWGVLTGICIAAYTVMDGWAIKSLGMQPLLFYMVGLMVRTAVVAPFVFRQMPVLRIQWQKNCRLILLVGVLSPLAYLLVLFAIQTAPLSYVAPVREVSMLMATFLGARWLGESVRSAQWMGAALMLSGVLMISLS
ncbi:MAG: EamA family transporter [Pseudomonadota bacterium]